MKILILLLAVFLFSCSDSPMIDDMYSHSAVDKSYEHDPKPVKDSVNVKPQGL